MASHSARLSSPSFCGSGIRHGLAFASGSLARLRLSCHQVGVSPESLAGEGPAPVLTFLLAGFSAYGLFADQGPLFLATWSPP